ncbi:MAG: hypothetical protein IPH31_05420 [Lewinellaceae bacterium]|nr:hypothetical protein [Lewinellaceae bacterium]
MNDDEKTLLLDIALAAILFAKRDFVKAAKTLPHYLSYGALDDIYMYAIAATLDTRIRYELDDLDDDYAEHMLHATATRLRRDDSLPPHRRAERLRFFPRQDLQTQNFTESGSACRPQTGACKIRQRIDARTVVGSEMD